MTATLELARELIARPSVSPVDGGCQDLIAGRLEPLGFSIERMPRGGVENLWARRGRDGPLLCLAGHTDVVPAGPQEAWDTPPFDPVIRDGWLMGRGSADMKAGLAALVVACEEFLAACPEPRGSLGFLVTSDEEGLAKDGTVAVVEHLVERGESIDWCLIGEPSSARTLGDVVRIGRRGSLSVELKARGRQGHVAYAELARNPLHELFPALAELVATEWDRGNEAFPPTGFQVTNLRAGTGVMNVIPGEAEVRFNFRYSTEQTLEGLKARVIEVLDRHGLEWEATWRDVGRPFLTPEGPLTHAVVAATRKVLGVDPDLSTGGGTSDGRFIAPTGAAVVELGHVNDSIHAVNERVAVADVERLKDVYVEVLTRLLGPGAGG